MSNGCRRHVYACSLRVARLNADGSLMVGANNLYVSDALLTISITPNIEAGDEFIVKSGCGELCVNVKGCDSLKRLDMTMGLCYPDPELLDILIDGSEVLTSGQAVGYAFPVLGSHTCHNGVSVEFWSKRYDVGGSLDTQFPYEHYVLPRTYWHQTAQNFLNGPVTTELAGFATENANWGRGPSADWPVLSDRVEQHIPDADLPTPNCGFLPLAS